MTLSPGCLSLRTLLFFFVGAMTCGAPLFAVQEEQACPYCGPITASAVSRNAGSNPDLLSSSLVCPGGTWTASVDLQGTGYTTALVVGFKTPARIILGGGQVLLVDVTESNYGELFQFVPQPGGLACFEALVPTSPAMCGFTFSAQALVYGGFVPFALSNAQDILIANLPQ